MFTFVRWAWDGMSARTIVGRYLRASWVCITRPLQTFRFARFAVAAARVSDPEKVARLGKALASSPLHPVFSALTYSVVWFPADAEMVLRILRAQASFPGAHRAWQLCLIDLLSHLKRWDEALEAGLELERRTAPRVPQQVLSTLGNIYSEFGDHENALKKYSEALLAAPRKPWLRLNVARQYFELGRMDDCREQMRKCAVECTGFREGTRADLYEARSVAARALEWMGQLHGALEAYHQASSTTRSADPCLQAARLYRKIGENQKALEMIDEAIRREPWRRDDFIQGESSRGS